MQKWQTDNHAALLAENKQQAWQPSCCAKRQSFSQHSNHHALLTETIKPPLAYEANKQQQLRRANTLQFG